VVDVCVCCFCYSYFKVVGGGWGYYKQAKYRYIHRPDSTYLTYVSIKFKSLTRVKVNTDLTGIIWGPNREIIGKATYLKTLYHKQLNVSGWANMVKNKDDCTDKSPCNDTAYYWARRIDTYEIPITQIKDGQIKKATLYLYREPYTHNINNYPLIPYNMNEIYDNELTLCGRYYHCERD